MDKVAEYKFVGKFTGQESKHYNTVFQYENQREGLSNCDGCLGGTSMLFYLFVSTQCGNDFGFFVDTIWVLYFKYWSADYVESLQDTSQSFFLYFETKITFHLFFVFKL